MCVNSHPAGEQSRRLELPYCQLVSPCVWTCTCWRAGLWLRGDAGGGVTVSARLSIRCPFVYTEVKALTEVLQCFACISVLSSNTGACVCCRLLLVSLSLSSWLPPLASAPLRSSPRVLLYSSPPSFTCRWAEEQYPAGHGDRQPPPCGLFLLLFLLLLLLGSCTLLSRHAGPVPTA